VRSGASEGVIGKETEIAALVRAALDSDVVRDAVAHGFRREMYVAAPIGTHLLEGYIDLTYRNHNELASLHVARRHRATPV